MKLKATIISLISIGIVGLTAILLYCFWPAIKGTVDKSKYYTQEELQESYDKGFEDGCKTETELTGQVKYYKELVDEYYVQVNTLNDEITILTNNNRDFKNQIQNLNNTITSNEDTINNLQTLIDTNNKTISELETEISNYEKQINILEKEITALQNENNNKTAEIQNKQNQVASLNNQVNSLQNLVNQLNATNETNLATINTLNNQIQLLNSQISELKLQINNNETNVADLNNKITDLEKSVAYYEQYVANLETDTQVVATFEFDGSVYNIQILNKGAYVSVVAPTSTNYIVFNGWTVNNEIIDLNTYVINENTKFIADVTYNYDVKFSVDNTITESQIVEKDSFAVAPTTPIKTGYSFNGWTVDGVNLVDVSSYKITANTIFTAVFTKMHNVTFLYEDETISTQSIKNGFYAENVTVENTTYKVFNGWSVNGTTVDITTYKISADTVFVADIIYKYDVTFTVDGEIYDTQIVAVNDYASNPTSPIKNGYIFDGWSVDGVNVIDISSYSINSNVNYIAMFTKVVLEEYSWADISEISQSGKAAEYFSIGDTKTIALSDTITITVAIMGFSHDDLSDGTGKAGITFGIVDTVLLVDAWGPATVKNSMYSSDVSYNWHESEMRIEHMNTYLSQLPSDLQSAILAVNKYTSAGNNSTEIITTSDKLWLFSVAEITGRNEFTYTNPSNVSTNYTTIDGEGSQYEYWKSFKDGNNSSDLQRYGAVWGKYEYTSYWLRSPVLDSSNTSAYVLADGQMGDCPVTSKIGVLYGFCV